MRINKLLVLIGAVLLSIYSYGQQADSKLSVLYTPAEISHFKQNNPDVLEFYNYYVNNATYFTEIPKGKTLKTIPLKKVNPKTGEVLQDAIQMIDLDDFNPYLFNCKSQNNVNTFYSIQASNKILVMRSTIEIQKMFNRSKNNTNK